MSLFRVRNHQFSRDTVLNCCILLLFPLLSSLEFFVFEVFATYVALSKMFVSQYFFSSFVNVDYITCLVSFLILPYTR